MPEIFRHADIIRCNEFLSNLITDSSCVEIVTHTSQARNASYASPASNASPTRKSYQVVIAAGSHLFPFRTEKLSPPAPMVLQCNAGE